MKNQHLSTETHEYRIDAAHRGDFESLVKAIDQTYFDNYDLESNDLPLLEEEENDK